MTRHIFASFHSQITGVSVLYGIQPHLSLSALQRDFNLSCGAKYREAARTGTELIPETKHHSSAALYQPPPPTHTHTPITVQLRAHPCCNSNIRGHNINIRSPPYWSFCIAALCTEVEKGAISGKSVKDGRTDCDLRTVLCSAHHCCIPAHQDPEGTFWGIFIALHQTFTRYHVSTFAL
jgi:hypothetical protein